VPHLQIVSCLKPNWEDDLVYLLSAGNEIDLTDFDYENCGKYCESMARRYAMEMRLDRDPSAKALHFRKMEPPRPPINE
jgi:hypothetical protein